jgi:hypothetical protein
MQIGASSICSESGLKLEPTENGNRNSLTNKPVLRTKKVCCRLTLEISPAFSAVQSLLSLKALYEDETELRKSYVTKVLPGRSEDLWLFISCYNPLNKSQIKGQWLQDGIHFAFAGDGSGSEYVVDPTDDHAEIKFLEHETGELKSTGVLMSEYLSLIDDQGNT